MKKLVKALVNASVFKSLEMNWNVMICSLCILSMMTLSPTTCYANGERKVVTLDSGTPIEFIWCDAGKFMMGALDRDSMASKNERPRHAVRLSNGFWISRNLVSRKLWSEMMSSKVDADDSTPKTGISFEDSSVFIRRLSEKLKMPLRMPTEAELEYAYRAGTETIYHWGDTYDADKEKLDNRWGISGWNLSQFCSDVYHAEFFARSPVSDPQCKVSASKGVLAVLRGGKKRRVSERTAVAPFGEHENMGLRLVTFSLEEKTINPFNRKTGEDDERLDVTSSPFFKDVIWIVDVTKGSNAEHLGVRRADILCRLGAWEFGGDFNDLKIHMQELSNRSKMIVSYRHDEEGQKIRSFMFPPGRMGMRFMSGMLANYRISDIKSAYQEFCRNEKSCISEYPKIEEVGHEVKTEAMPVAPVGVHEFVAAVRSGNYNMTPSDSVAQSAQMLLSGADAMTALGASMQQNIRMINDQQADAVDFQNRLQKANAEEQRALYRQVRLSVESKARQGNNLGAMNEFAAALLGLERYKAIIGEDCAEWLSHAHQAWMATMQMDSNAVDGRIKAVRPSELQCKGCGLKYYGRLTCPQCSAPRYGGEVPSTIRAYDDNGNLHHIEEVIKR